MTASETLVKIDGHLLACYENVQGYFCGCTPGGVLVVWTDQGVITVLGLGTHAALNHLPAKDEIVAWWKSVR